MKKFFWGVLLVLVACAPAGNHTDKRVDKGSPKEVVASAPVAATVSTSRLSAPAVTPHTRVAPSVPDTLKPSRSAAPSCQAKNPMPYHGDLALESHPHIDTLITRYSSGRGRYGFKQWMELSGRYLPMMQKIFAEEGVPQDLTYLAMIESGFNERAYSSARAAGPWQFIESTGRLYGLEVNRWIDERRDPEKSTRAAARLLKELHDTFDNDWLLAAAAYNAGPGTIRRAIEQTGSTDFWRLIKTDYLRKETKNYIPKLMAALHIASAPQKYGFTDLQLQSPLAFDRVKIECSTDLAVVAQLCRVPVKTIRNLNSELKRRTPPPLGHRYTIRIPEGTAPHFKTAYQKLPEKMRANLRYYRVEKGDHLGGIAQRFDVPLRDLMALNKIKRPRALRVGKTLVLPLGQGTKTVVATKGAAKQDTYKVQSGDNLWSIARRFDTTSQKLRAWNQLGQTTLLKPGQQLIVRATSAENRQKVLYTVKPGDTLWGIGRQFKVGATKIRQWNNLHNDHVLRPGQHLTLLVEERSRG